MIYDMRDMHSSDEQHQTTKQCFLVVANIPFGDRIVHTHAHTHIYTLNTVMYWKSINKEKKKKKKNNEPNERQGS